MDSPLRDMPLQKESEWEKRFDEKFGHAFDASSLALVSTVGGGTKRISAELKSFIREAISTREKEIAEEVGKLRDRNKAAKPADHIEEVDEQAYDAACREVLSILKH